MRCIVHLSDLHFGRVDNRLLEPLIQTVSALHPHVIVVSGDLTQRARSGEFKAARAFLDRLPAPQIVVPGNHDVPLHNVFQRFLQPLTKYRRYITDDLDPIYQDKEIIIIGVNTARSLTFKSGRINTVQLEKVREQLDPLDDTVVKFVVTHHPLELPDTHDEDDLLGRSGLAMELFAICGVDVLLGGHLHVSHTGSTALRYRINGYAALAIQAGTATSIRGRGEANSFNVIHTDGPAIRIVRYGWDETAENFSVTNVETYARDASNGWQKSP